MSQGKGTFSGTIKVVPPTDLQLVSRPVGRFHLSSVTTKVVDAQSTDEDAEKFFRSKDFLDELSGVAWDLVWEKQVAVEFEPDQGKRVQVDDGGRQIITMDLMETVYFNQGNPRVGLKSYTNFDLLQKIRDHIIRTHIAGNDVSKTAKLMANAAILVALEHFVKGIVNREYALAEFYSLAETVENQLGGRAKLRALVGKADLDNVTSLANQNQFDQRHAPADPENIVPLPPNALMDAGRSAKLIIQKYAETIL